MNNVGVVVWNPIFGCKSRIEAERGLPAMAGAAMTASEEVFNFAGRFYRLAKRFLNGDFRSFTIHWATDWRSQLA